MNVKYFGKKIMRNEFGDVVRRLNPCVTISYTKKEEALALKRLEATGYEYDLYGDGCSDWTEADVYLADRDEAMEFLDVWREVK